MSSNVIPTPGDDFGFILNHFSMNELGDIPITPNTNSSISGEVAWNSRISLSATCTDLGIGQDISRLQKIGKRDMFGFTYEARPNIKVWDKDPYCYRIHFNVVLIGRRNAGEEPVDIYEAKGDVTCPEFDMEEYLHLRRKHLLWTSASYALREKRFGFTLQPIMWEYKLPENLVGIKQTDEPYKEKVRSAFGSFIRGMKDVHQNVEQAIKAFYGEIDEILKNTVVQLCERRGVDETVSYVGLRDALSLPKEFGVYKREYTADLFDYLFGDEYAFYNGDTVRIDEGRVLIPNFWVKTSESEILQKKFIGYGARTSIIEWGTEPYPWVLFRINMIWNDLHAMIKEKVAFARSTTGLGVIGREVYIVGLKNGKMRFKKLSDKYFGVSEDRRDLIVSLAIGELEGVPE